MTDRTRRERDPPARGEQGEDEEEEEAGLERGRESLTCICVAVVEPVEDEPPDAPPDDAD